MPDNEEVHQRQRECVDLHQIIFLPTYPSGDRRRRRRTLRKKIPRFHLKPNRSEKECREKGSPWDDGVFLLPPSPSYSCLPGRLKFLRGASHSQQSPKATYLSTSRAFTNEIVEF